MKLIFSKLIEEIQKYKIKIHNTNCYDYRAGESFCKKVLTIDGIVRAMVDISILDDEVYIKYVETSDQDEFKRKGLATMLVDALIDEHPEKYVTLSDMTPDGLKFFKKNYILKEKPKEYDWQAPSTMIEKKPR